jgi:predicted regulator of Ras-like GTPase activity (Roadblock/LC7/MglB family)
VLDTLAGLEPELKAAAVLSDDGQVIASTLDDAAWKHSASDLVEALAQAGTGELDSSHIATEEAEVFMVKESGFSLVAVTARFVLASLTSFDIRMSLRDLAAEADRA